MWDSLAHWNINMNIVRWAPLMQPNNNPHHVFLFQTLFWSDSFVTKLFTIYRKTVQKHEQERQTSPWKAEIKKWSENTRRGHFHAHWRMSYWTGSRGGCCQRSEVSGWGGLPLINVLGSARNKRNNCIINPNQLHHWSHTLVSRGVNVVCWITVEHLYRRSSLKTEDSNKYGWWDFCDIIKRDI